MEDSTKSDSLNKEAVSNEAIKDNPHDLKIINQLIQNGQPQLGVFATVKKVNYLDYHSYLISQKSVAKWRKDFKANQFAFIQIVQPPYRICLALATIKLATTAFVYLYNEDSQVLEVCEALNPLQQGGRFKGDHYQGQMAFINAKLTLTLDFLPDEVTVKLDSRYINLVANLSRYRLPLAVCSPSGRRGWTFTQKEPFCSVTGQLTLKPASKFYDNSPEEKIEFDERALANLDWTLGFMRHETNWFWCCINSWLADGRHFMLNLSMGVNETGVSENACWLDGEICYLPPVMFRRHDNQSRNHQSHDNEEDTSANWTITHQDLGWSQVAINLCFTPLKVYQKTDNFGLIASIFEQWLGVYSGEIRLKDRVIKLDNVIGLAEDHFAKW
ncbi:MAG: DUF2804 domain-containing protein [Psychrobacter sp.]|nr:DUF2804 domain-containing protein [Psychrobacter sp.]